MIYTLFTIVKILIIIIFILISVAYFTLAERKILGAIHRRRGPNVIGVFGLLQPLADGLKLFLKETILPANADQLIFIIAPILTFIISLMGWAVIPFSRYSTISELNLGLLYILAISSIGVYGIIMSGWSSNSKYSFLGSLRSAAQMVSYEVSIGFIIISIILCVGSFNLQNIIEAQKNIWFIVPFFPLFLMFCVSGLAETNRHPFDLPEAEAELVSGYNVEYSAMGFALFSLGEYGNMLVMSSTIIILFLGGWLAPFQLIFIPDVLWFALKICLFVIFFIWIRAALPRYRYDQLMSLGWKAFLPLSISYLILVFCLLISFNLLPY
jgi:NADH-quinone oxidoreductase subunit H